MQAALKSFTAMSGCASRGTTVYPQEVHIINLRRQGPDAPGDPPTEVRHPGTSPERKSFQLFFLLFFLGVSLGSSGDRKSTRLNSSH